MDNLTEWEMVDGKLGWKMNKSPLPFGLVFIDVETEGWDEENKYGDKISEFSAFFTYKATSYQASQEKMDSMKEKFFNVIDGAPGIIMFQLVVWDKYIIEAIKHHFPNLSDKVNKLLDNAVFMKEHESVLKQIGSGSNRISEVTRVVLGRKHKGNSLDDLKDLVEVYYNSEGVL